MMFHIRKLFLLYGFCYFSVKCSIPTLNVLKLDRKLIARKRQDTLDMCRMFTEENNRLELHNIKSDFANDNAIQNPKRVKRDLKPEKPNFNVKEAKRIETIVDKLYDDMAEHGERVSYRQRNLSAVTAPVTLQNKSARRFNFAPATIIPISTPQSLLATTQDTSYQIPWPKYWKHGIVPYFIDPNTYDTHLSDIIIRAFDYFEKATCIRLQRLRERPTDKESLQHVEWLYITNPSGIRQCVHSNEKKSNRGVQMVVFGYDCLTLGEVLHEVMHILGFSHEHTRPDRDQYITVLWDNIKPGYKKYFEMRTDDPLSSLPYDYSSVLHYPSRAFSKNGQVTLLVESGVKVGQREGLSDNDIAKVTTIYSPECTKRNKEYLLTTCPSVVKMKKEVSRNVTQSEIENYFKDRIWPYGIINYKIKNKMEFSSEERENLDAVIRHIEKETCIEFRDMSKYDTEEPVKNDPDKPETHLNLLLAKEVDNEEDDDVPNELDTANNNATNLSDDTDNPNPSKLNLILNKNKNYNSHSGKDEETKESEENYVVLRKNNGLNTDTGSDLNTRNKSSHKSSYTFGNLFKESKTRKKVQATQAGRRHAESTLTLVRSAEPGCRCPLPGRPKGDHVLSINSDCFNSVNDLLHLFVHVLGLDHQHNMHDRDSYLRILWDNLTPDITKEMQNILPPAAAVGFPYDYQSVTHYPWLQIKNGVTNIMYPIWNDGWAMGHWQGLSSTDVNKLNLLYYEQCALRKQHTQE